MSILHKSFNDPIIQKIYLEKKQLDDVRNIFEHYVFNLYNKVSLVVEIKNKFFDIKSEEHGTTKDDVERYVRKQYQADIGFVKNYNNMNFYYKRWTNNRLKRIKKIMDLNFKSKFSVKHEIENVVKLIALIKDEINQENDKITDFYNSLFSLYEILELQYKYIIDIYPLKDWTIETHENLFNIEFMRLLAKEIKLIYGIDINPEYYNTFQANISKAIHEHTIPNKTVLDLLIKKNIEKARDHKKVQKLKIVKCYHARPEFETQSLFPLNRKTSFFVNTDIDETRDMVKTIYNDLHDENIEIYEILIPENLFKYSIVDNIKGLLDDKIFGDREFKHSYVFKNATFPKLNEYYIKGIIKYRRII